MWLCRTDLILLLSVLRISSRCCVLDLVSPFKRILEREIKESDDRS